MCGWEGEQFQEGLGNLTTSTCHMLVMPPLSDHNAYSRQLLSTLKTAAEIRPKALDSGDEAAPASADHQPAADG